MDTESLTAKSGHLAWCAMMAVLMARQEGRVRSPAEENLFITRWLMLALKQRRFPRDVAPDIQWLMKIGQEKGAGVALFPRLEYLWHACSGKLAEQNALFRLTYAIETARRTGWISRTLSDREWSGRYAIVANPSVNALWLLHTSLDAAFCENGHQLLPLKARISGNVRQLEELLLRCGWYIRQTQTGEQQDTVLLQTEQLFEHGLIE